ncbi:MAG: hypothetical protein U5Q03_07585 [Bacteroidota bacterium]|nr:hypothetical protein [Bacteroidota bacterium]
MSFINKHHLGSPATVSRSLNALLDKEMMYQDLGENSNKTYFVYDLLLRRWNELPRGKPAGYHYETFI